MTWVRYMVSMRRHQLFTVMNLVRKPTVEHGLINNGIDNHNDLYTRLPF